jgi:hypothetical protein
MSIDGLKPDHADVVPRRPLSGVALGAAVALGACTVAPDTSPRTAAQDKVAAAFAKVDREIARAKARWSRDDAAQRQADGSDATRTDAPAR